MDFGLRPPAGHDHLPRDDQFGTAHARQGIACRTRHFPRRSQVTRDDLSYLLRPCRTRDRHPHPLRRSAARGDRRSAAFGRDAVRLQQGYQHRTDIRSLHLVRTVLRQRTCRDHRPADPRAFRNTPRLRHICRAVGHQHRSLAVSATDGSRSGAYGLAPPSRLARDRPAPDPAAGGFSASSAQRPHRSDGRRI